jgi:hypothetical protein
MLAEILSFGLQGFTFSPWFHRKADANATRTEHPAMMETF